ncbi:unnamed protein product [Hermetia illucens]|uniref:3-oxoacyl-[acyl-carrier-protein] synthase n=1 Tax=Hermetia illucens TaxID=343691 RepID=A0A7R8V7E7_HERIL|nr:3-oxoacyl-[acyl-carrier-protein] synthase, mitochondrial [Hermetia illucens]CAD7093487.1 unnamed protein product [Hermetia illucens]
MALRSFRCALNLPTARRFSTSSKERRVVVTGVGAVSPLGNDVPSSWKRLLSGECGISALKGPEYEKLPCRIAAQLIDKEQLLQSRFSKSDMRSMSQATMLVDIAADEALRSARLESMTAEEKNNVGVSVGMGMFDLADIYTSYAAFSKGYSRLSPFFIPRILPNMACGHVSIKYGFKGPNHSVSTACATGVHSIGDAFRFIKYGDTDVMICGSGESCIDPLSVGGFCRLRALSTSFNDSPKEASRPFDSLREGFVMGEGAAILVLEELDRALERKAPILAEILGYGMSGDANHLTAPCEDGSGASLAMLRAMKDAKIDKKQIGYVNAHATSTPTGDVIEARAIRNVLGDGVMVSSTKGAHGHLLGSAGNLEAVFVIMGLKEGFVPPSINIKQVGDGINLNLIQEATRWKTSDGSRRTALKNSFGFGGTNATLCIAEYREK